MKTVTAFISAMSIAVAGCSSTTPHMATINGYYYLVGDKDCALQLPQGPTTIACGTKKREMRGYRQALTTQDLEAIRIAQLRAIQQHAEYAQIAAGLAGVGQTFAQAGQQILQQSQQFQTPQVQQYSWPQPNRTTTYTQVGSNIFGSNGVNYRQNGDVLTGSDGTRCQTIGRITRCK